MKFIVNNKQVTCMQFCKHCCIDMPIPNGYYNLIKHAINCQPDEEDKVTLDYYISEYEKRAKARGIKL